MRALPRGGNRPIPGVHCPKCGGQVVYNGNHFCEHYDDGSCDWALSHRISDNEPIDRTDQRVWREIQAAAALAGADEQTRNS